MGKKSKRHPNKKRNDKVKSTISNGHFKPSIAHELEETEYNLMKKADYMIGIRNKGDTEHVFSLEKVEGRHEFVALDVPIQKTEQLLCAMEFLRFREVEHGRRVAFTGDNFHASFHFLTVLVEGKHKKEIMSLTNRMDFGKKINHSGLEMASRGLKSAPLFQLVPEFNHKSQELWGQKDPAPEGRIHLVHSILDIWNEQSSFLLNIDGDLTNFGLDNLKLIDLAVALSHAHDWCSDWISQLSLEQTLFVRKHNQYFSKIAEVLFRCKKMCCHCGLVDHEKLVGCVCKQAWYCCPDCQIADWPNHKKNCKELRFRLNNKPRSEILNNDRIDEESDDDDEEEETHCPTCTLCGILPKGDKFYLCSGCEIKWYCCHQHQLEDWPNHKTFCKASSKERKI